MVSKKILVVIGTRPNFIKVTQFKRVAALYPNLDLKIVHTGQHFDAKMADVFFSQFNLAPDYFLNISTSASPNTQVAEIMLKLEALIKEQFAPDLMMVVGDVNSTMAAAITANKLNIPIAHVESGLRSFDKTMPEEHNRVITDAITRYYLVTEPSGRENLLREGVSPECIFDTGNTMIDTLVAFTPSIDQDPILDQLGLTPKAYVLMTMHRPSNVDHEAGLKKLLELIRHISEKYAIVFPAHPRTQKQMEQYGLKAAFNAISGLTFTEPLNYFAFQKLIKNSKFILTDSGGIQEESTFLQVPCLTLRENTERPVTCTVGSNTLVPFDLPAISDYVKAIDTGTYKKGAIPELWDGRATERIFKYLHPLI